MPYAINIFLLKHVKLYEIALYYKNSLHLDLYDNLSTLFRGTM